MPIREILTTPNKMLRLKSRKLKRPEITSSKIQTLVSDMYETLKAGKYGVGMSAIQIGEPLAVIVVMIRPTPNRPDLEHFSQTFFNLEIIESYGNKEPMWEGCCSVLDGNNNSIYAKVPRYKKIKIKYCNEKYQEKTEIVDGFLAHVLQHEMDHLNGIIFTDLVPASSIITQEQYRVTILNSKA